MLPSRTALASSAFSLVRKTWADMLNSFGFGRILVSRPRPAHCTERALNLTMQFVGSRGLRSTTHYGVSQIKNLLRFLYFVVFLRILLIFIHV